MRKRLTFGYLIAVAFLSYLGFVCSGLTGIMFGISALALVITYGIHMQRR